MAKKVVKQEVFTEVNDKLHDRDAISFVALARETGLLDQLVELLTTTKTVAQNCAKIPNSAYSFSQLQAQVAALNPLVSSLQDEYGRSYDYPLVSVRELDDLLSEIVALYTSGLFFGSVAQFYYQKFVVLTDALIEDVKTMKLIDPTPIAQPEVLNEADNGTY